MTFLDCRGRWVFPGNNLGSGPQEKGENGGSGKGTLDCPFSTSPGTNPSKTGLNYDCF